MRISSALAVSCSFIPWYWSSRKKFPLPKISLNLPASSASPQNYVQTGAFTLQANAEAEKARLQAVGIDDVQVVPGYIRGQTFYRVQIGPIAGAVLDATLVQKLQGLGLSGYSVVQQ